MLPSDEVAGDRFPRSVLVTHVPNFYVTRFTFAKSISTLRGVRQCSRSGSHEIPFDPDQYSFRMRMFSERTTSAGRIYDYQLVVYDVVLCVYSCNS